MLNTSLMITVRLIIGALLLVQIAFAETKQPPKSGIASAHYLATEAGHEILAQGGNAFDAAVAMSAMLGVVEPASSGFGGGGFWLLHFGDSQKNVFVDGRETAPTKSHRDMFLNEKGEVNRDLAINGALSAGIPGQPAGLVHIAEKYGKLPLSQLLAPALKVAQEGFPVDEKYHSLMNFRKDLIKRYPSAASIFLINDEVPKTGAIIKQPDLAFVIEQMTTKGKAGFYQGEVAEKLVKGVTENGGIWTLEDLANYKVVEREPIIFTYHDATIISAPPPSSGGITLAIILNILEAFELKKLDQATQVHLIAESMRRAYRDRNIYLGDPDFAEMPIERLLSSFYADGLRASIRLDKATPSDNLPGIEVATKGTDTTHFSVIDKAGNMVAATLSINLPYGSGFVPPGTGVLLNNEMDDFSMKKGSPNAYGLVGDQANAIEPNKRMLSSMTPTFFLEKNKQGVIGTPGGSRIITMVLLGLLDAMENNKPSSWVKAPRFHHQYLPDVISFEPNFLDDTLKSELEAKGHKTFARNRTWGNMHAVLWDKAKNKVYAASDPRWKSGKATVK